MLPFNLRHKHIRPDTYKKSLKRHKGIICETGEILANEVFSGAISADLAKMYKSFFLSQTSNNIRHLDTAAKIDLLQDRVTDLDGKFKNLQSIDRAGRMCRMQRMRRMKNVRASRLGINRDRVKFGTSQNEIRRSYGKQRWTKAQKSTRNADVEKCRKW